MHVPLNLRGILGGVGNNPCSKSCSKCHSVPLQTLLLGVRVPARPAFLTLPFTDSILNDPLWN